MDWQSVIHFWYQELSAEDWFRSSAALDDIIRNRFAPLHTKAKNAELFEWREFPLGRLAEIIILDQFSRNIYRSTPEAFAQDLAALALAQEAISQGIHHNFSPVQKAFLFMPFMHSESKIIHEKALKLFSDPEVKFNLEYEIKHKEIIEQFGRYPHRNKILGRKSSAEELEFLKDPNNSF